MSAAERSFSDAIGRPLSEAEAAALQGALARALSPLALISDEEFAAHLAAHRHPEVSLQEWLSQVHAGDLRLALAAARGNATAVSLIEAQIFSQLPLFLARLRQTPAFVEDVGQLLREQLYMGTPERPPRLLDYSGRGSLASWARVISLRTAIGINRKRSEVLRDANQILDEASQTPGSDPELAFIRRRCREHFVAALEEAVAGLEADERTLLRLHFHEGVTLDELAPMFHVHRTTVARRIAAARQQIIQRGREILSQRLALSPSELASMIRMMNSHLDLSLGGLLQSR